MRDTSQPQLANFILAAILALAGCASTTENLQRESARSIGDVQPETVKVSNVNRGATSVTWDAESTKGPYGCSADDMIRRMLCLKK